MERLYDWLISAGYPREGVDWLRRHRLAVIVMLAALAWVPVLVALWLFFRLAG